MNNQNQRIISLIEGSFGGLIAGYCLTEGWFVLMVLALALLWSTFRDFYGAFLWGALAVLVSHVWILELHPLGWIGVPDLFSFPLVILIWLICSAFGGLLVSSWTLIGKILGSVISKERDNSSSFSFVLVMSSIWGLSEVLLSKMPLFWIGLASSLFPHDLPLVGLARWFGSGGLATLELLIGWMVWRTYISWRVGLTFFRQISLLLAIVFAASFLGNSLLRPVSPEGIINVAVWQTAIPVRVKFSAEQQDLLQKSFQKSFDSAIEMGANVLVVPEGTLFSQKQLPSPAPLRLLAGGFRWANGQLRNTLLFFEKDATISSRFIDKHRLVPLGEWMPTFFGRGIPGLSAIGGIAPGPPSRLLDWEGPLAAVAICYELTDGNAIAKAVESGAEWVLSIANLDPYPISLQRQFLALAQLRSIETGRELVTASNTGPSSLISPTGQVRELVEPFKSGVGLANLRLSTQQTFYTKFGDYPLLFLFFVFLMLFVFRVMK